MAEGGDETAQGQPSRGIRAPGSPTDEVRREHERTHIPYRSLCDACVKARGRADQHGRGAPEDRYSEPQISADYWFMGRASERGREDTPALVLYERVRKALYAHVVPAKGVNPQAIKQIVRDLQDLGIKKAVYKTDQENPIKALFDAVRVEWP